MRENSKIRNSVLDTLWKNPVVGLAVYDAEQGTLKDANNAFLDLLDSRFRTKKTLGMPIEQCLPDFDLTGLKEVFQRTLTTGMPFHSDSLRLNRSQMGPISIACTILPLTAEGIVDGGVPQGLLLIASERKSEVPVPDSMNLIVNQTRHALARHFHLSAREIDIVTECLQGKKNRQIAQDLHIGISTVKRHLESAYRKMGISSSRSLPLSILGVIRSMGTAPAEVTVSIAQRTQQAA
jgi:DNA-binding CsgD family transcriptional regulator